jgi:DNA topoisomerase IB
VSRKYYIHPKILAAMSKKSLDDFDLSKNIKEKKRYSKYELLALSILKMDHGLNENN